MPASWPHIWLLAALCALAPCLMGPLLPGVTARRVLATVPYTVKGGIEAIGPDGAKGKLAPSGQLLIDWELSEKGSAVGRVYGACRVVSVAGDGTARALCAQSFEWSGGASAMAVQASVAYKPGGSMTGPLGILGGIGKWQGAHGEDSEFRWSGGAGGGRIVLFCLDGVC